MLGSLWRYRSFILSMVKREFQARYLGSALGSLWAVLNPLAMILIYTVIFGHVMGSRLQGKTDGFSYGIFLCAGLLTWSMFIEIFQRCVSVFVEQGNLIKKMTFPRATLPAIVLLSAALHFAIVIGLLLLVLLLLGRFPGWATLGLIPLLLLQQSLALGMGVALGVLNVFFRDVGHVTAIFLQLWFWFTPIVYPLAILGERARSLVALNPMTSLVAGYQEILLEGRSPSWVDFIPQLLLAIGALVVARIVFRRLSGEMADYL